jgi:hypothetical protein
MSACLAKCRTLFILPFLLASIYSCDKPSYPVGKVEESVLKLCKDEYNLTNVQVKIIGSTLGVYIPIEGLVDPDMKLDKDAGEKIENVALSIHAIKILRPCCKGHQNNRRRICADRIYLRRGKGEAFRHLKG